MKVSVITPVYNAAKFLSKAVESALVHEEVMEVILVEDASKDNSLEICKQLANKHKKVKLLQHPDKQNHGAGASRNLGIKAAQFEYIAFLDADDYFLPNRFIQDKAILTTDNSIDGVYNALGFELLDKKAEERFQLGRVRVTTFSEKVPPEDLFENMAPLGGKGYFSCDTLTVRKHVFNKTGLFDTSLELTQDTHMWVKMAATCKLTAGEIKEPVAIRGVHQHNRVGDTEKLQQYRPILLMSLYKWSVGNKIEIDRVQLLFNQLIRQLRATKGQHEQFITRLKWGVNIILNSNIFKNKSFSNQFKTVLNFVIKG